MVLSPLCVTVVCVDVAFEVGDTVELATAGLVVQVAVLRGRKRAVLTEFPQRSTLCADAGLPVVLLVLSGPGLALPGTGSLLVAVGLLLLAFACATAGVAFRIFRRDGALIDQFADVLAGNRVGDVTLSLVVEPDTILPDVEDVCRESLLCAQIRHYAFTSTST